MASKQVGVAILALVLVMALTTVIACSAASMATTDEQFTELKNKYENATGEELGTYPREMQGFQFRYVFTSIIITGLAALLSTALGEVDYDRWFNTGRQKITASIFGLLVPGLFAILVLTLFADDFSYFIVNLVGLPTQLPYNSRLTIIGSLIIAIVFPLYYQSLKIIGKEIVN